MTRPSDIDPEFDGWTAIEDEFDRIIESIGDATDAASRRDRIKHLIARFEHYLFDSSDRELIQVLVRVSLAISSSRESDRVAQREVWAWLRVVAATADEELRVALGVTVFSSLTMERMDWTDEYDRQMVGPLFELWFSEETRWAVFEAYANYPQRLEPELNGYLQIFQRSAGDEVLRWRELNQHFEDSSELEFEDGELGSNR